jgi:PPM family protein phosphatase
VTRAVGVVPDMEVESHDYPVGPGDAYFSGGLPDGEIRYQLASDQPSLGVVCNAVVTKANDSGGHDNILVILIRRHEHRTKHRRC